MCLKTSQSLDTHYSKFIILLILFSLSFMENPNQSSSQSVVNIVRQQPINPIDVVTSNPSPLQSNRISLDERIRNIQVANSRIQASSRMTQSRSAQSVSESRPQNKETPTNTK